MGSWTRTLELFFKFPVGYLYWYTPDEDQGAQRLKGCGNNNKDGDNNPHENNINNNSSYKKFRQNVYWFVCILRIVLQKL